VHNKLHLITGFLFLTGLTGFIFRSPDWVNPADETINHFDVKHAGGYSIIYTTDGSGQYISLGVFDSADYNLLKQKLAEDEDLYYNSLYNKSNKLYLIDPELFEPFSDGFLLAGDFDLDGKVEIAPASHQFWKGYNKLKAVEIDPLKTDKNHAIEIEKNRFSTFIIKIFAFISSIFLKALLFIVALGIGTIYLFYFLIAHGIKIYRSSFYIKA